MVCVCVCVCVSLCVCASAADIYRHMLNGSIRSFREGFPHLPGISRGRDPRQSANDTEPVAFVCHQNSEMVGSCMVL